MARPPKRNTQAFQVQLRNVAAHADDWRNYGTPKVHPTDLMDLAQRAARDVPTRDTYSRLWHDLANATAPAVWASHGGRIEVQFVACAPCQSPGCVRPAVPGSMCNPHTTLAREAADA